MFVRLSSELKKRNEEGGVPEKKCCNFSVRNRKTGSAHFGKKPGPEKKSNFLRIKLFAHQLN